MPVRISTYVSSLIEQGRRRIKLLVSGRSDIRTTYESSPFGIDGVPPANWRAIYADTGEKGRNILLGYINQNQLAALNPGENHIYSTNADGSKIESFIKLNNDGTMDVLGNDDFMVRFNALETGFNQLRTDFNNFLTQSYNLHTHASAGAPPVPLGTASTASIANARIDEIRTTST